MKKINRRSFLKATGVAAIAGALAACGETQTASSTATEQSTSQSEAEQTEGEVVNITYSTWGGVEEKATEESIIAAFEAQNPNIKVEMIFVDGNYEEKLQTLIAGNETPDVVSIGSAHLANFSGALQPLDAALGSNASYIAPMLKDSLVYEDSQWALPKRSNTKVFAYNKDLLTQAGVEFPGSPYEIDQFTQDAIAVSELEGIYGSDPLWYEQWIFQFGGETIDENGKIVFNSDIAKEAVQYCIDAADVHGFAPPRTETEGQDVMQWFISGTVGFKGDFGPYFLPLVKDIQGFEWDICQAPGNGGQMEVVGIAMGGETENAEAAATFIEFVSTSKEAQEIMGTTSALPVTEDGKAVFLAQYPDKNLQAFFDAMQVQSVQRNVKGASEVAGILFVNVFERTRVGLSGTEDVSLVLDEAAVEAQEALDDA